MSTPRRVDRWIGRPMTFALLASCTAFGVPGGRLTTAFRYRGRPMPTLQFQIEERGWFTDLSRFADMRLPAGRLHRIVVRLQRGDLLVTDDTRQGVVRTGTVGVNLRTDQGRRRS